MTLHELIKTIADRVPARSEATLQADIRQLLLTAPLNLEDGDLRDVNLETQLGDRRRIDIELGSCVIEVKKDLRKGGVAAEATHNWPATWRHEKSRLSVDT